MTNHPIAPDAAAHLDRYFDLIGYDGERMPTLAVLRKLHLLHALAIPFENLSPLLGLPVRLDIPALFDKFVQQRRGGYCFEQNLLFQHVLHQLGFQTKALAARIRWNVPDGVATVRGHMLILVEIDGKPYIADVGFGGLTLTAPLRLITDVNQDTPHGPFRLRQTNTGYLLSGKTGEEWKDIYAFDLGMQLLPDYEVSNWYLSTHPQSHFVTGLMVGMPTTNGRHALLDNRYSFYGLDGSQQRKTMETVGELKNVLEQVFHIRLPDVPHLDEKLQAVLQQGRHAD